LYDLITSNNLQLQLHLLKYDLVFCYLRLERKTRTRKRVFATLKVVGDALEQITKEASPQEAEGLIPEEVGHLVFLFFCI